MYRSSNSHNSLLQQFLLVALILAGLAGNYFKFSLFLNIDLLFGSIFAMLVLQLFDSKRGIIAAAIISSYTYFLWNHPYAIIFLTLEVALVSWLTYRRKVSLVLADTLYWLVIGMPLIFIFFHEVMNVSHSNTYIIMIKHAVNGIANTLLARLIFTAFAIRSHSISISYKEIIYNLLSSFVLFPALMILAIASRSDFAETDRLIRNLLINNGKHNALVLEAWLKSRKTEIVYLAELAKSKSANQMASHLEHTIKSDINFERVGILDKDATSLNVYPYFDELGNPGFGKNYSDRPYLAKLKQTLSPMLTEVVTDKIGTPKPIVMMLAPVVIHGVYSGYVAGVLNLKQMHEHLQDLFDMESLLYTVLDVNGNVIMTNRKDQKIMAPFVSGEGTLHRLDKAISQWMPQLPSNTPNSERWSRSYYVMEAEVGAFAEWKLILEQPIAPFQKTLYINYSKKLTILFLVLLGSLAIAEFLSRRSVSLLEKMLVISKDLPAKLMNDFKEITWPKSAIMEAEHLIINFQVMALALSERFYEINQFNSILEQRIAERTSELQQSRDEWEHTFNCMPDYISIIDLNHNILHANKAFKDLIPDCNRSQSERSCYKVIHGLDSPPDNCPHSRLLLDGLEHQKEIFEPGLNKFLHITATPIHDSEGVLIASIHVARDITDRINTEEDLATLVQEVETRNRFVESVITNLQSGIIVIDLNFRIKMVNCYVAGLCGSSLENFIGKNLADISHDLHENLLSGNLAGEMLATICKIQLTIGYTRVDLINAEGNVVGYIISFKDLSEIIRIRNELRQKERLSAMGEVVARVAHEMRNPLFGMTAAAQILEMELILNPCQKELMDSLLKESRRLNNLVEELLDTTRETRINKKRINLIGVINESIRVVEAMLHKKQISLGRNYSAEIWVSADFEKLEQVIINLVKNALEASNIGGHINIDVATDDDGLIVTVTDNGCGITAEHIDRIFDVFYTTKKNGTGMGLSISRGIIEAHGGRLTANSNPEKGTMFVIQLPYGDTSA